MRQYIRELYFIFVSTVMSHMIKAAYRQGYEDGLKAAGSKKDADMTAELEGFIMGYLRDTFKEKANGPTLH